MSVKKNSKKRRKFNLYNFAVKVFLVTALFYLASSIFLRAYNSYLNVRTQEYMNSVVSLRKQNEVSRMEVNQLSTYDRISAIASEEGMTVSTNIININNE